MTKPPSTNRKKTWIACGLIVGLGAFALFNNLPRSGHAAGGNPLDEFVLYGIGSQSGSLVRYQFNDGTLSTVGSISNGTTTMTGIQASAYVPRNSNIFTFWNDPSDGQTKLVYVNATTAKATVVGQPLGTGSVTAAVATMPNPSTFTLTPDQPTPDPDIIKHDLYAVKGLNTINFQIVNQKEVVPEESFAAKITILGCAISTKSMDFPATMRIHVGGDTIEPWGPLSKPVQGNVNEDANDDVGFDNGTNPRSYVIPNNYPAGTPVTISGQTWWKGKKDDSRSWTPRAGVNSSTGTNQVITLRNGDPAPNIEGFGSQASAVAYVADYIDPNTNTMVLGPNQAIYLFELWTSDMSSAAADFQDMVVLVTLGKNPAQLAMATTSAEPVAQLINVDPRNGMYTDVMPLTRLYDGLAATSAQEFYGTYGGDLYAIDPATGTETLIGTLPYLQNVEAFETAGGNFYGFAGAANQLREIDAATGQIIGADVNTGITGLGSLTLIRLADEPQQQRQFD